MAGEGGSAKRLTAAKKDEEKVVLGALRRRTTKRKAKVAFQLRPHMAHTKSKETGPEGSMVMDYTAKEDESAGGDGGSEKLAPGFAGTTCPFDPVVEAQKTEVDEEADLASDFDDDDEPEKYLLSTGEAKIIIYMKNRPAPPVLEEESDEEYKQYGQLGTPNDEFDYEFASRVERDYNANGQVDVDKEYFTRREKNNAIAIELQRKMRLIESENPEKRTAMAEQVDDYVDIGDEMPTATYQSIEIEKGAEVTSIPGGSGSGSSSSSGSESGSSGNSTAGAANVRSLV